MEEQRLGRKLERKKKKQGWRLEDWVEERYGRRLVRKSGKE